MLVIKPDNGTPQLTIIKSYYRYLTLSQGVICLYNHITPSNKFMYKEGQEINSQVENFFKHRKCAGLKVLDLGCGAGANAKFLKKRGAEVATVDIDIEVKPDLLFNIKDNALWDMAYNQDIVLCINVLQFLTINEIKKIIPKILNTVKDNGIIMIQMFNSPVTQIINNQLGDLKILDYRHWIQKDKKPYPHTHAMVSWIIKK